MKLNILVLIAALAVSGAAEARAPGGQGGGRETASPSAPSSPGPSAASPSDRDSSAQRTNYIFALDGTPRRTMNPGFCARNASDHYVRTNRTVCDRY